MSRILGPLCISCLVLLTASGSMREPTGPLEVTVVPGIVFGKGGDQDLKLDLAKPSTAEGTFPVIVCIHGGGWTGGGREQMNRTIQDLAARGYVAVCPDYRLAPANHFPAPLEDCKAAIRWVRANIKDHKGNPDRIGVIGFSAGGHLACLLGVTTKADGMEGKGGNPDQSSKVQAVVSFFGPTDLGSEDFGPIAIERNLIPLLGGTKAQKPELYKMASPLFYSCKDAPPFLFFHGAADTVVSPKQSKALAEKLEKAGGSAKVVIEDGVGHGWGGELLAKNLRETLTFFNSVLKK